MSPSKTTPNLAEIRQIIFRLNHGSRQQQCEAAKQIEVLVSKGVPSARQALPALIVALEDRSWSVREHVMRALAAFPPSPDIDRALANAVRTTSAARRRTTRASSHQDADSIDTPTGEKDQPTLQQEAVPNLGAEPAAPIDLTSAVDQFVTTVVPKYETLLSFLSAGGIDPSNLSELTPEVVVELSNAVAARWCKQLPILLDPRSASIVIRRLGLNGEQSSTLQELGQEYGVTRERIRQIENKGMQRLKHWHKRRALLEAAAETAGAILGVPVMPPPERHDALPKPGISDQIPVVDTTAQPLHATTYLAQSLADTQWLVMQGKSLSEIMQARGVMEKTVYKHLALLIERGQICVEQVLPAETIAQIQQAIGKQRPIPSLAVLRQRLPVSLTFGEIRCVIAAQVYAAKNRSSKAIDRGLREASN